MQLFIHKQSVNMKQITKTILLCLALLMMGMSASAQGLKAFKLRNGLSVSFGKMNRNPTYSVWWACVPVLSTIQATIPDWPTTWSM